MAGKLYVLVRADMPVPDQCVQACHVVADWMMYNFHPEYNNGTGERDNHWPNSTLVLLTVKNEKWLEYWMQKVKTLQYTWWQEPDMNDEFTALACYTEDEKLFSKLPLWNPTVR